MASTKEDGTEAAAEQLGAISIAKSAERKVSATTKNGTPTKLLCSECGKKSSTLKKCTACQCVWYCGKDCQNKHWKEHKKECRRIKKELDKRGGKLNLGTEKDVGPLPDLPPREECPICMHALPIHENLQTYYPCCGKTLCCGCDFHHKRKSREQALPQTCAFCRSTAAAESDEEVFARTLKRAELKDLEAMYSLAMDNAYGRSGLPVDQAKCIELLREAAGLGNPVANYQLGCFYDDGEMGLAQNKEEALKYWEKAAEGGHLPALYNIGCIENNSGNGAAAMHHWRLSASGGMRMSMEALLLFFEAGLLYHADLAESIQAFYCVRAEMKSIDRDLWVKYLKETGKYKEEYDM